MDWQNVKELNNDSRIITALDFPTWGDALGLVEVLGEQALFFKVGLELFSSEGPGVVRDLLERDKHVFVDLKLFDIPRTVERTASRLASLGASLITIHTMAGMDTMKGAAAGVQAGNSESCKAVGVTVLTSVADTSGNLSDRVLTLAVEAKEAGLDGVISAVSEARRIKSECGDDFLVVTPGIRLRRVEGDDQKRSATAREARAEGADFIVVGRPIARAEDPKKAFSEISDSMG
jgi:orotidine-5'-phosphate decarboxylase